MKSDQNPYLKRELASFLYTFKRQPLLIKKASGSYVWDAQGRKYLDFYSGIAVCGVGHNNAQVVKAIQEQSKKVLHTSNYFYTEVQLRLAEALTKKYPGSRVFLGNSGAESNELAIKLARLWATHHKKSGREIITFYHSFHGRTLATVAASGGWAKKSPMFAPFPAGFRSVPYNDLTALTKAITKKTIAIMVEPIQGEGGINVATDEFMKGIEALCRRHNLLFIVDEIQSGMGRTGHFFGFEHYGVKPDIISLAKGLAGGLPLSATLSSKKVHSLMVPGLHGSTFGGNPVACAAALEVIKLLSEKSLRKISNSADYILRTLNGFSFPEIKSIRGRGLMIGIELSVPGVPYVSCARERGLLINCTQNTVLRFLPPYFISRAEMDRSLSILKSVFQTLTRG